MISFSSNEIKLLCHICSLSTGINFSWDKFNWEIFLSLLETNRLIPIAYKYFKAHPEIKIPPNINASLKDSFFQNVGASMILTHQIKTITKKAHELNIECIFLKGAHLAFEVYEDPAMRPMGDIDILVMEKDIEKFCNLMSELGYTKKHLHKSKEYEKAKSKFSHISPYTHYNLFPVELHLTILWTFNKHKYKNITCELWKNSRCIYAEDVKIRVLSPEYTIIYLIFHIIKHLKNNERLPFLSIFDIYRCITYYTSIINWKKFYSIADDIDILAETNNILSIIHDNWQIDIPLLSPVKEYILTINHFLNIADLPYRRDIRAAIKSRIYDIIVLPNFKSRIKYIVKEIAPDIEYLRWRFGQRSTFHLLVAYYREILGKWL